MATPLLLGAHTSTAKGLHLCFERAQEIGATAVQIFTRNQRQWKARPVTAEEVTLFRRTRERVGVAQVISHASYLLNLANPDSGKRQLCVDALVAEYERCTLLGIEQLVLHPGAHLQSGLDVGIGHIAQTLDAVLEQVDHNVGPRLVLENVAGQGTTIGSTVAELGMILERCAHGAELGICIDTAHAFAAGYDLRHADGLEGLLAEVQDAVGFSRLSMLHLNDSQAVLASRRDRHARIGEGEIGLVAMRQVVHHPRLRGLPMILETPAGMEGWAREIDLLRVPL